MKCPCKVHPKYKGEQKPRVSCEACWAYYFGMSEQCVNCGCEEKFREINEALT